MIVASLPASGAIGSNYIKRSISFPALLNEVKILTLLITQERAYKKSKIFMFLSSDFNLSTFD